MSEFWLWFIRPIAELLGALFLFAVLVLVFWLCQNLPWRKK